jgi:TetR/AcrR family transcriptional repressor of mexCD-oprJ operon
LVDEMTQPALDHRRATAERNAAAILDATERLVAQRSTLSMAAVAAEAGVSRPTLYAHYKTLGDLVEAAVARAVNDSLAAVEAAEPDVGPADEALRRLLAASWGQLARHDALARAAAEHLPSGHVRRTHAPLMARLQALVERGQGDGAFRTDLPADWLVTAFYALVHSADDHARAHRIKRPAVLEMLTTSVFDLFAAPHA